MWPQTYKSPFALNDASDSYLSHTWNFQTEDSRNKDINFYQHFPKLVFEQRKLALTAVRTGTLFLYLVRELPEQVVQFPTRLFLASKGKSDRIFEFFDEKGDRTHLESALSNKGVPRTHSCSRQRMSGKQ